MPLGNTAVKKSHIGEWMTQIHHAVLYVPFYQTSGERCELGRRWGAWILDDGYEGAFSTVICIQSGSSLSPDTSRQPSAHKHVIGRDQTTVDEPIYATSRFTSSPSRYAKL
jgi:hypothetical protein